MSVASIDPGDRSLSPVVRSSLALMASSAATMGLGFIFWIAAAHLFTPTEVGLAVAAISAVELITALASLGWRSTLLRFVGAAGGRTRHLIALAYTTAGAASLFGAVVFLAGRPLWAPDLDGLAAGLLPLLFVTGCVGWMIFQLQDSVLIGIQKAGWVPIENATFSALRVLLLIPIAAIDVRLGIFVAWAVASFPVVAVVNIALARRLPPRSAESSRHFDVGHLAGYAAADWVAKAAGLTTVAVVPLIVLAVEGPAAAGAYYVAWTLVNSVRVVSANVADALVASAGTDEAGIGANAARAGRLSLGLSLPMVATLVLAAPLLLSVFGPAYADQGTGLLRLMALSAVPYVALKMSTGLARSTQDKRRLVALTVAVAVAVLGLSAVLLRFVGLPGVGLAWLLGVSAVAAVALATDPIAWWRTDRTRDRTDRLPRQHLEPVGARP